MGTFTDIIPSPLSDKVPEDKKVAYHQKLDGGMTSTGVIDYVDEIKTSLEDLKARLDSQHIKLGGVIGVGDMGGVVYDLLDQNGKVLPSVVLRIEGADTVPPQPKTTPGVLKPVARLGSEVEDEEHKGQMKAGYYAATIVPRGKEKTYSDAEYAKTLASVNSDGMLEHLTDLERRQFMEVPGMPIPVITDLGCYRDKPGQMQGTGSVEMFSEQIGADYAKVKKDTLPASEMAALRAEQDKLHEHCLAEVKAAGIKLDAVPTKQTGVKLTALEEEKKRGEGKA